MLIITKWTKEFNIRAVTVPDLCNTAEIVYKNDEGNCMIIKAQLPDTVEVSSG
jgi:hypothetical protein